MGFRLLHCFFLNYLILFTFFLQWNRWSVQVLGVIFIQISIVFFVGFVFWILILIFPLSHFCLIWIQNLLYTILYIASFEISSQLNELVFLGIVLGCEYGSYVGRLHVLVLHPLFVGHNLPALGAENIPIAFLGGKLHSVEEWVPIRGAWSQPVGEKLSTARLLLLNHMLVLIY